MNGMDYEAARRKRDRRIRRAILDTLHLGRGHFPTGYLGGRTLLDLVESTGQRFDDDGHAMALLRDLDAKGLIEVRLHTLRRGQKFGPDLADYRITAKGISLIEETIPPDMDIDDDRIDANTF